MYPNGTPLVVGCHGYNIVGLGLSAVDPDEEESEVLIDHLTVSGMVSGILVEKVLNNNWFMVLSFYFR